MLHRRAGRELAVQFLYQWSSIDPLPEGVVFEETLAAFWPSTQSTPAAKKFAEPLIRQVVRERHTIDQALSSRAHNWDWHRIAPIEKAILRLAAGELLFSPDTPRAVVLNEAVELTKHFSSPAAAPFVNGVLDALAKGSTPPPAAPSPGKS